MATAKKANPFAAKPAAKAAGKPAGKTAPMFKKGVAPTFPPVAKKAKKG